MTRSFAAMLAGLLAIGAGGAMHGAVAERKAAEQVGDSRLCLANGSIVGRVVEDERTIRFETLGGRVYRNRLSGPCPGLRQAANGFGALGFELHGESLCRGDLVRVVDPARGGTQTLRTATACPLGAFERIAPPARRP
ncbi:MAG TPA: hypothetical protein VMG08_10875 [Allosphingosinicella sp.]|nr:hypothetical protein [Allosphingosinicella sp.]